MIKIAINGFGRIGRLAFRRLCENDKFEVVAINDLTDAEQLAYLLKYDSIHKTWKKNDIDYDENENILIYKDKKIPVLCQSDIHNLKWKNYNVDIVLECTGRFKNKSDAQIHIDNGAKSVIISAPSDKDVPTYVYGVNSDKLTADQKIISGASCTTNCLAIVCKVLCDNFTINAGYMTTIHAYTNDQTTLDLVKKDLRRGRAAPSNIIPTTTGAAKAINLVIPELNGKLKGEAIRVPVNDGSLVVLTLIINKKTTVQEINKIMKNASETYLKNVLDYNEDEIVSSDIIGNSSGSIFDATQTTVFDTPEGIQIIKITAWYDNEFGYTCQFIRLVEKVAEILNIK